MKKTLIVLCSAIALVGCDQNRGGTSKDTSRDTGFRSSRDTTYPSSRDTNTSSLNAPESSVIATNTNKTEIAPYPLNGTVPETTPPQTAPENGTTPPPKN